MGRGPRGTALPSVQLNWRVQGRMVQKQQLVLSGLGRSALLPTALSTLARARNEQGLLNLLSSKYQSLSFLFSVADGSSLLDR